MTLRLTLLFALLMIVGCSDTEPMTVGSDMESDSGNEDLGIEQDTDGDVNPDSGEGEVLVQEDWDKVDVCLIDYVNGPIIIYAESVQPESCVRVVLERFAENPKFEISDGGFESTQVLVSPTPCESGVLTDLSGGVSAVAAEGSVEIESTELGQPIEVQALNMVLEFPAGENNPIGAFVARFSLENKVLPTFPDVECENME